jgi:hypothetical protein
MQRQCALFQVASVACALAGLYPSDVIRGYGALGQGAQMPSSTMPWLSIVRANSGAALERLLNAGLH